MSRETGSNQPLRVGANAINVELFEANADKFSGLKRLDLLKFVETVAKHSFEHSELFNDIRSSNGDDEQSRKKILDAALNSIWVGIDDLTEEYYKAFKAASTVQQLIRYMTVQLITTSNEHGFSDLECCFLRHFCNTVQHYDAWFLKWFHAVSATDTAKKLLELDKTKDVPAHLFNHYTVVVEDGDGFAQEAYCVHFAEEMKPIGKALDMWIADLKSVTCVSEEEETARSQHVAYFELYKRCLFEKDATKLEGLWTELDVHWLGIKYWMQFVHDIEYGYADPLRHRVSPQFSLRLLDETYDESNKKIEEIQAAMVEDLQKRTSDLAAQSLNSLRRSSVGIYYVPTVAGEFTYSRFMGQAIPNRTSVRFQHGTKIYFDLVQTQSRENIIKETARKVLADGNEAECIRSLDSIVWHTAAHEMGHAMYGLEAIKDVLEVTTMPMLEEPRAELTSLRTLQLLRDVGMLDSKGMQTQLLSFLLSDLRRFVVFDSHSFRPYVLSAMANYRRAAEVGYARFNNDGKLVFDHSKADNFLEVTGKLFLDILDAEDRKDGPFLEQVKLDLEAAEKAPIVTKLVGELFVKAH